MATKTKTRTARTATARKAKAAPNKAAGKTSPIGRKVRDEAQTAQVTAQLVKRVRNGDEKLAVVAKELGMAAGPAAFLLMKHDVAEGNVPAITAKSDSALAAAIVKARNAADEHSSWGWISARTGVPEAKVKKIAADAGAEVKGSQIASVRKANRPVKKSTAKASTKSGRKTRTKADPS